MGVHFYSDARFIRMPTSSLARYEVLVSNLNSESRYTLLQGHDRKSGKAVTINTWALSNSVSSTLFENEKAAYQRLSSARCESLCPILEIFESESTAFVVMEQKTMTLQEFVSGSCPQGLPKKVIQSIFREICEAVRTLHNNGIAHLDLHPENIYLDQDYKPTWPILVALMFLMNENAPLDEELVLPDSERNPCWDDEGR